MNLAQVDDYLHRHVVPELRHRQSSLGWWAARPTDPMRWLAKTEIRRQKFRGLRAARNSRGIIYQGKFYPSVVSAAKALKTSQATIYRRLRLSARRP